MIALIRIDAAALPGTAPAVEVTLHGTEQDFRLTVAAQMFGGARRGNGMESMVDHALEWLGKGQGVLVLADPERPRWLRRVDVVAPA